MVRIAHQSGPGELGVAGCVEHAPVHTDAAFIGLPRLVECLDDVVVDAVSFGARDELAQHARLLDATGIGLAHVVTGAGPAELGNHDTLARMGGAQFVIELDGLIDGLSCVESVPVRQNMGGDEVDRGSKLRVLDPYRPDFAGRDRYRTLSLYTLDKPQEVVDRLFRAQRGLIADHDRIDVAVAARKRDGGLYLPLVASFIFIDPNAERDFKSELGGDRRHQLTATGRAVGADRLGIGSKDLQVGTNLLRRRAVAIVRML